MNQLCMTTIPVFQQSVLKWQQEYFENTLQLTPTSLVIKADQECQVLKHEGQWVEILDPSILALHTLIKFLSRDLVLLCFGFLMS